MIEKLCRNWSTWDQNEPQFWYFQYFSQPPMWPSRIPTGNTVENYFRKLFHNKLFGPTSLTMADWSHKLNYGQTKQCNQCYYYITVSAWSTEGRNSYSFCVPGTDTSKELISSIDDNDWSIRIHHNFHVPNSKTIGSNSRSIGISQWTLIAAANSSSERDNPDHRRWWSASALRVDFLLVPDW